VPEEERRNIEVERATIEQRHVRVPVLPDRSLLADHYSHFLRRDRLSSGHLGGIEWSQKINRKPARSCFHPTINSPSQE
jgi:hypothetical protein